MDCGAPATPVEPREQEHAGQQRQQPDDSVLVTALHIGQNASDRGVRDHRKQD